MKVLHSFCFSLIILFFAACGGKDQSSIDQPIVQKTKEINPFSFYKNIEIKPGLNFEVLSWGKGVDTLGGFLILMSDSSKNSYKSISVERKGIITDSWNMDLDNDGNPEIYIQYLVRKNVNDLNVYEYANGNFNKISFPGLRSDIKDDYKGNDKFFIKGGDLFRSVPIVTLDSGKTTNETKTFVYRLSGNSFSSTEIKP
jgi:hypothetical protein